MKKRIILIGDLHNQWYLIKQNIKNYDVKGAYYIHVGDFPIGFHNDEKERLIDLNDELKNTDNHLLLVRGNHDDPAWYKHENHRDVKDLLTNITFVQDYDTLEINDENWLFIGGAVSVDRKRRMKENDKWFMDEKFTLDEERLKNMHDIRWVVTHTAPHFCEPQNVGGFVLEIATYDMHLIEDIQFERNQVTKAYEILNNNNPWIKGWFYGHFHRNAITDYNGCKFACLNIGNFCEITRHEDL